MGLLDEAIREHLELKRRAGADAGEVARQEREALGPVVRGDPMAVDPAPQQPVYEAQSPEHFEAELYDDPEDDYEDGHDEPETTEHQAAPSHAAPPQAAPAHYPPAAPPAHPQPAHPADQDPQTAPGDDDVLEQTPEFLQETPEHDRLWFEQAPPQEFDFDK